MVKRRPGTHKRDISYRRYVGFFYTASKEDLSADPRQKKAFIKTGNLTLHRLDKGSDDFRAELRPGFFLQFSDSLLFGQSSAV